MTRAAPGAGRGRGEAADRAELRELNGQFIEAFRAGSWDQLRPVLAPGFGYLDGAAGAQWDIQRYIADLRRGQPGLATDQVVMHLAGDVAVVSARTWETPGRRSRYADTYARLGDHWACVHACVWPLAGG